MGLGAGGAALATALSRGVVCLLLCTLVAHSGKLHDPGTVTLADCRSLTGKMLRIGVPTASKARCSVWASCWSSSSTPRWAQWALAANAAAGALSCIATLPGGAISLAMLPVIGQAIGADKPDEARRLGRKLLAIAYVLMLGTGLRLHLPAAAFGPVWPNRRDHRRGPRPAAVALHFCLAVLPGRVLHPCGAARFPEMCATPWSSAWRRCWSFASG